MTKLLSLHNPTSTLQKKNSKKCKPIPLELWHVYEFSGMLKVLGECLLLLFAREDLGEIIDQVLSDSMNHYGFLRNHISSLHGRFVAEIFSPFFLNQTYRPLQVRLLNLIGLTDFCEKECRNDIYGDLLGLVFYRIIYVCCSLVY